MDGAGGGHYLRIDNDQGIFQISRRCFVDQAILERERNRIFGRCWLYLGHETEIAKPGDFLTRSVGGRNLIFNRDRNGVARAVYNTCPHRGATVCRERHGNAKSWQCFYHGWVFDGRGELRSRPGEDGYRPEQNRGGAFNLMPVENLDHYRGLYFVNFATGAGSLAEYLGNAREYIDLIMDQGEDGMEIVGGGQDYSIHANWKLLGENSIDGYHPAITHATYRDYLANTSGASAQPTDFGFGRDLGNGHGVLVYQSGWGRPIARWVAEWGEQGRHEIEHIKAALVQRHGAERAERIATHDANLLIFPNLVINDVMAVTLRTYYPERPDKMMVSGWALAPRGEAPKLRERRLNGFLEFLGPGGFATPDDVEALEHCQRGFANIQAVGWSDISKGMMRDPPNRDDEEQMRAFWRGWNRLMTAGEVA